LVYKELTEQYLSLDFIDIFFNTSCTAGYNPAATAAVTEGLSGTYLTYFTVPTTCGNYITKWNYCYYTQNLANGSQLSMTLAVWTVKESGGFGAYHPSSITSITVFHTYTPAKVFCGENSLSRNDFLPVHSDETMIGVVLPSHNPVPVIGSGDDSLYHRTDESLEDIRTDYFTLTSAILHIEAVIGSKIH